MCLINVFHVYVKVGREDHYPRSQFMLKPEDGKAILAGTDPDFEYRHVAGVLCAGLDAAFELTNHIDGDWALNREVATVGLNRKRSTSVGDMMRDENGVPFMVSSVGFTSLK